MGLKYSVKNLLLVIVAALALSACATQKKVSTQIQGDVYTGTETVKYLAKGVPDRVFFATNKSVLTTASRDTLRKQAACFLNVSLAAVVKTDLLVAKKTLSGTPLAKYLTVSVPV